MKKKGDNLFKKLQYVLFVCVIIFGFITIVGTGGGGGGGSGTMPDDQKANFNDELESYPTWKEFAAVEDAYDEPVDITTTYVSNEVLCTTTPYSLTQNPEEIVTFGTAPDVLWLGSLIQGDSYLGGLGSLEELPIRQRAPLTIAIKVLTGTDITREVEDPDSASVQQALSEIVAEAEDSGYETGGSSYYLYKESYSSEQMALSLGVSYRCMGTSAKATMDYKTSEEKNTVTAYFKQVMFEAYIVRPQTPAEFFSADFTQERLDEQIDLGNIGTDNLPVYVSRIQYGRILMYSMTSTASMEDLELAAKYGYDGWVGGYDSDMQDKLKTIITNAEIKVVAIGGG